MTARPPIHRQPWFVLVAGLAGIGFLGAVIGGTGDPTEPAARSASAAPLPSSAAATTTTSPSTAPETTAPATSSGVDFVMPDLVGMDLQSAQNAVQSLGVFLSVSHDLRGSRNQVVDSNWVVCDQNVAPGQQVTGDAEGQVDFGVVKREESCP